MSRTLSAASLRQNLALAYADSQHPVTKTLTDTFGGYAAQRRKSRKTIDPSHDIVPGKRCEIASESLCDDVISYLASTLEPYKGCTIIDVHPGACLWSSKLHDYLKPKHHLLMEPEHRYFEPFIKPLLDKPGSTYRHTQLTGAHPLSYWDSYKKLMNDSELLPCRPPLDEGDPRTRQLDTSMLLTGNLWRKYDDIKSRKGNSVKYETLIMQHMSYASLANDIIHQGGLVRMLWWLPDEIKHQLFSKHMRGRRSYTVGLSMGSTVTEVAGVEHRESKKSLKNNNRQPAMDTIIANRVKERMAVSKIETPKERRMADIAACGSSSGELEDYVQCDMLKATCETVQDVTKAADDLDAHMTLLAKELKGKTGGYKNVGDRDKQWARQHIAYPQALTSLTNYPKQRNLLNTERAVSRTAIVVDANFRLINLECNYAAVAEKHPNNPNLADLREHVLAVGDRHTEFQHEISSSSTENITNQVVDDIVSLYITPSILTRDARQYEPLQAQKTDFWPNYELALIDLVPKTRDISVPEVANRTEAASTLQMLLKHLFMRPSDGVIQSLERLAPNAAQDLVPLVPGITDARVGGRMDSRKARVKMLAEDTIVDLVKAFLQWPFRPSNIEMALATESDGISSASAAPESEGEVL